MRKILLLPTLLLAVCCISSCLKDKATRTYSVFEPVYLTKAEVLANIKSSTPKTISNPGKIYLYDNFIFLNEINKGVHIIDNTNPSVPVIKAFINIPGNIDIAVKGDILYADLFTDMVAINISNPLNATLEKIVPAIFPERQYGNGFSADSTKILVDWIEKIITEKAYIYENSDSRCISCSFFLQSSNAGGSGGSPGIGVAGSLSRFSIINNYLYAVNSNSLNIINIANAANPVVSNNFPVGWEVETIYPFKDKLFLGTSTGMIIYDIANPTAPSRQLSFAHARACDPVIADDYYAYVTLRAGNFCAGIDNELNIVDVQNLQAPSLVKRVALTNPFGLAKERNILFICDGKDGLKIYNTADVINLKLIKHISNIEAYDAIAWNNRLLLVAKNGLYQYDYSNISNIRQISRITVNR